MTETSSEHKTEAGPKSKVTFGIGTKIIGLNAILLLISISSVVFMATQLFVEDSTSLIKQMTADSATSLGLQTRELFENINNQATALGSILSQSQIPEATKKSLIGSAFLNSSDLMGVLIYKEKDSAMVLQSQALSPEMIAAGESPESFLQKLAQNKTLSLSDVLKNDSSEITWFKLNDDTTVLVLASPLTKLNGKITNGIISLIKSSKFDQHFSNFGNLIPFLVDRQGTLLVHPDQARVLAHQNLSSLGIVKLFLEGKLPNGQARFLDPESNEMFLGSFQAVGFAGLGVIAEVPEKKAMEASQQVKFRSLVISIVILALSFMIGYIFSNTMTWPIVLLSKAAERIAAGDFKINLKAKGKDEIAHLSQTFNQMAKDLENREKLLDVFNKFHNKEIAEKLLSGEIKLGGEKKRALVFFSDIRSFTSISEKMNPEDVVEMLNEYMGRMVTTIRRNNGIVDKFIGDAIMAVWGVPESQPNDAYNALKACLEMRQELASLNQKRLDSGKEAILIGMGLNSGEVIAGNIGSSEKMEYTVIGDTVNTASRIEGATKVFGTDLLVAQEVQQELKDRFIFSPAEKISAKGKSDFLSVYRVLGFFDKDKKEVRIETPYSQYQAEESDKSHKQ